MDANGGGVLALLGLKLLGFDERRTEDGRVNVSAAEAVAPASPSR